MRVLRLLQTFSFGIRRTARETLTEIGDRAGLMTLRISAKRSRTVRQPLATASAGTTSPGRIWWLSSTGNRAATTSTSCRPRSSAISTECSTSYIARLPRFRKPFKKEKERYSKRSRGKQQRRPSPEDGVVLENGERQGERGHPPGWALAPQQARSHWKWRQSPRGRGDQPPGWALVPPPQRACSRWKGGRSQSRKALALAPSVLS